MQEQIRDVCFGNFVEEKLEVLVLSSITLQSCDL